ncbi:unnamed protein product [Calypogeia fissa]
MADSILSAQVVINDGSVVTASSTQNSDLFRALKGAGANSFGIVTQLTFQAYDVSQPVTYFEYHFSKAAQFQALKAYQIWGVNATPEVSASLDQNPSGGNRFYGVFLGPQSNLQSEVQTYLSNVPPPTSTYIVQTDYIHSAVITAGFNISTDPSVLNLQNGYVYRENPGDGWVHRDALFNIQMKAYWTNQPQNTLTETDFVEGIWNAVRPYSSSQAYQNYIDVEEPLSAYYANNLNSLIATKKKWDSTNVFNFNQSIPLE